MKVEKFKNPADQPAGFFVSATRHSVSKDSNQRDVSSLLRMERTHLHLKIRALGKSVNRIWARAAVAPLQHVI